MAYQSPFAPAPEKQATGGYVSPFQKSKPAKAAPAPAPVSSPVVPKPSSTVSLRATGPRKNLVPKAVTTLPDQGQTLSAPTTPLPKVPIKEAIVQSDKDALAVKPIQREKSGKSLIEETYLSGVSQGTKALKFVLEKFAKDPTVVLGPVSMVIPGKKKINELATEKVNKLTEEGKNPLANLSQEADARRASFTTDSPEYQKASLKEKVTKHLPETLYNLVPDVAGSAIPYLINPTLGFAVAAGSTAEDVKQKAVENGVPEKEADAIGLATGLAVGALDRIVPDEIFGGNAIAKTAFSKGFFTRLAQMTKTGLKEAVTEVAQEDIQLAAEATFRDDLGWDEIKTRNVMAGLGGLFGGAGMKTVGEIAMQTPDVVYGTEAAAAEVPPATSPPTIKKQPSGYQSPFADSSVQAGSLDGSLTRTPSNSTVVTSLPETGTHLPSLRTEMSPVAPIESLPNRYVSPSQVINTDSIQSQVSTVQANSQNNVEPFKEHLAKVTGIEPDVRVKKTDSILGKIERYAFNGKSIVDIGDVLAARVIADPGSVAEQLDKIKQGFDVVSVDNYFDSPTEWGYHGVNIQTRLPNGMLAEVQIHTPESVKVAGEQHKLYEKWRNKDISTLSDGERSERESDLRHSRQLGERASTTRIKNVSASTPPILLKDTPLHNRIMSELIFAEKGERIAVRKDDASGFTWSARRSTFPSWIPADLRRKPLLDAVAAHIQNGTVPTKAAELRLYKVVAAEMEAQNEVLNDEKYIASLREDVIVPFATDEENSLALAKFDEQYGKLKASQDGSPAPGGGTDERVGAAIQAETKSTEVAAEKAKPVRSTKAESRVLERLRQELPELGEGIEYTVQSLKENTAKAVQLVEDDKTKAYRIAMGVESAPENQTQTAVSIALAEKALEDGNLELYGQLTRQRTLEQTRRGQEIVAEKGSVTDNSTSRYVKELVRQRLAKYDAGYLGALKAKMLRKVKGSKAIATIDEEVGKIKERIKNTKELDLDEAQKFLDSLACK